MSRNKTRLLSPLSICPAYYPWVSIAGQSVVWQLLQNLSCKLTLSGIQININKKWTAAKLEKNYSLAIIIQIRLHSSRKPECYFYFSLLLIAKPSFGCNNRAWSTHVFVLCIWPLCQPKHCWIFFIQEQFYNVIHWKFISQLDFTILSWFVLLYQFWSN